MTRPSGTRDGWMEANRRALTASLAVLRERFLLADAPGSDALDAALAEEAEAEAALRAPSALARLVTLFGLTPFERGVLLLVAARDLDARFAEALEGRHGVHAPTFGLALSVLPEPHWDALAPGAPLRRFHLVNLGAGASLARAPLELDERVLHFLAGVSTLDARLEGLVSPLEAPSELVASQREVAERIVDAWRSPARPVVQLHGMDPASRRMVAAWAAASVGLRIFSLSVADLPDDHAERALLLQLWEREAMLVRAALLLDLYHEDQRLVERKARTFLEALEGPAALSAPDPIALKRRVSLRLEVRRPDHQEQRLLWRAALGERAARLASGIDALVAHFDLGPEGVRASVVSASPLPEADEVALPRLWAACRDQARPDLEGLAARVDARARWEDLVLPDAQKLLLREMMLHARHRLQVTRDWGFDERCTRGLGLTALFAGPSGTGKTLAAEVLANALNVDLYRIDLSATMSKYIGETEKNLRRIFDAAEGCGAILLFDEADALFGKRSEVKDSHDRYANIEVSYLLQRMEAYGGLAILTTNLKSHLDQAFLRRIRFVVQYPFPAREQRREIWRRVIPAGMPAEGLDFDRLAQLNVSGGNIRNIAFNAAVLAADERSPLRMGHLLRAARAEYAKLEQPLTAAEIGGWR